MASTSTSSIEKSFKYDVFLSFRGEDTRKGFVDHLFYALQQKNIHTYKDDERIEKGKRITDELIRSIEDSKFYVIVFSRTYASSSWCLDELVKIMELQKASEHTAYPVFYDVEPTEVRKQIGSVGEAFRKHEKEEAAGKWRDALKDAAELAGWELNNTFNGHEAKLIQKIVQDISLELRFINSSIDEKLVGMETRVKDVVSSLETCDGDVCMLGIKGMGGAGKTTLARAVFDQISVWFEGSSFVENVREVSKGSSSGLKKLQKQILLEVLNDKEINVSGVYDGKYKMKKLMHGRKVLIVLDDVDHIDQLDALAGEPNWFKRGSKIIITTRDEQVLVAHGVNLIRDVNLLSDEEAICLFNRYAFRKGIPITGYEKLLREVLHYVAGLPLTIRVLGSFLCGKDELEWKDALERLKTIPSKETLEILELSYMGLEEDYREIFLDVACILKGKSKGFAIRALESCGFNARNGLRVLEQKSLITIDYYGNLDMHDRIEEMGQNIVRRLHPDEPCRHSRLWNPEEIGDILVNDLGTEETKCIKLSYTRLYSTDILEGLRNMKKLRLLSVDNHHYPKIGKSCEFSQSIPNGLQYLYWNGYPFTSLPENFLNNLVGIEMRDSSLVQFWEGGERKVLKKLRFINLKDANLRTLDLGLTPVLETLELRNCNDLIELQMPVESPKLKSIALTLSKLRSLDLRLARNLEKLEIEACEDLVELHMPSETSELESLNIYDSKLRTLDLGLARNLKELEIQYCGDLVELHMPSESSNLEIFKISISMLTTIDLELACNLKKLDIEYCGDLIELRMPVETSELESLNIYDSKLRTLDLGLARNLKELEIEDCGDLVELHMPIESSNLNLFTISHSKLRTLHIGLACNLKKLKIKNCGDLEELCMPVETSELESLDISYSKLRTLDLGLACNLKKLEIKNCGDLEELCMPVETSKLESLNIWYSKLRTLDLVLACNLKKLEIEGGDLEELCMPVETSKLESLNISYSKLRTLDLVLACNLKKLEIKGGDLEELCMPVETSKLESLNIWYSKLRTLDLGLACNLKELEIRNCGDLEELCMPVETSELESLKIHDFKLRTLDLGLARNLERLEIKECRDLVELHMPVELRMPVESPYLNIFKMSHYLGLAYNLKELEINNCDSLVELHARCGCLENLANFSQRFQMDCSVAELCLTTESLETCELHSHSNLPKLKFKCYFKVNLPSLVGNLEKLISFGLCSCTDLERFSGSICSLQHLRKLTLSGSIPEAPKDLGQLQCLDELVLSSCTKIKYLPDSICMLPYLTCLKLESCWHLEKLPEDLGRLDSLHHLYLSECISLQDLPKSICEMKRLKRFHLPYCFLVEKLPEEIGCLECLEELNIEGTGITRLPLSIFGLKGLRILGSRWRLESYGFTSQTQHPAHSQYASFCYI